MEDLFEGQYCENITTIICRFANEEDLQLFNKNNGTLITKDTCFVRLPENICRQKSSSFEEQVVEQIDIFDFIDIEIEEEKKGKDYYDLHWKRMPEFNNNFSKSDYARVEFSFQNYSLEQLQDVFGQNITEQTLSVWFPKLVQGEHRDIRVLGGRKAKYPIYVVSKSRYEQYRFHTSNWLSRMCQDHYICVEPQEYELYANSLLNESVYCHIIVMDMTYKTTYNCLGDLGQKNSTGPGAARNFCSDHARKMGFHWCWILDDNSENFDRYWRGRRILCHSSEVFRTCEEFCDRYKNIGIAGLNYSKFCVGETIMPPFVINTRIYSYGLWNLDCPYITQEGRYNEDTIQSLNILKKNWCSVQFNCYTGAKVTTQKIKGGNTKEFYEKDEGGTLPKSQMLVNAHPDVSRLVWKFSRWHHEVNYKVFKQKLEIKEEFAHLLKEGTNIVEEHDTYIIRIPKELCLTKDDNRTYLEKHYPKGCANDITNSKIYLE